MVSDFSFKLHETYRYVVALCDSELVGEQFVEGERLLDLSTPFFAGEQIGADELKDRLLWARREDATFYIVGEKSVGLCVELGLVDSDAVGRIDSIPFALILL